MPRKLRITIQLLLIAYPLLLFPLIFAGGLTALLLAAFILPFTPIQSYADLLNLMMILSFGIGWLGIIGLVKSIFISKQKFQSSKKLRIEIMVCLTCGYFAAAMLASDRFAEVSNVMRNGLEDWTELIYNEDLTFFLYLCLGPSVLGIWNIYRLWFSKDG